LENPLALRIPLRQHPPQHGGLAELVDALDSKSSSNECGFESHSRYHSYFFKSGFIENGNTCFPVFTPFSHKAAGISNSVFPEPMGFIRNKRSMRRLGKWSRRLAGIIVIIAVLAAVTWKLGRAQNINPTRRVGTEIDRFQDVPVFYNGGVDHSSGRNLTQDGYNLGQKHQCVEFVKRYYDERFHHRMPDSYGHAKDYYDPEVRDGHLNRARNLKQYTNGSRECPAVGDLLVFGPSAFNRFGHVAIVSEVHANTVEIVQQNAGPFGESRETLEIRNESNRWRFSDKRVRGWLRMPKR